MVKKIIVLMCLMMVLTASVASAASWTTRLWSSVGDPPVPVTNSWVSVLTTAMFNTADWTWTYAMSPTLANNIWGVQITLGTPELVLVNSVTSPTGWTSTSNTADGTIAWQTVSGGPNTLDNGETFTFGFNHPWGPTESHQASALSVSGYSGPVNGPAPGVSVPEPASMLLGLMGLSSVAGYVRRRKS